MGSEGEYSVAEWGNQALEVADEEIYNLIDGEYQLAASAQGTETAAVTAPFVVAVVPARLVEI